MMQRSVPILGLCAALVLAGCSGDGPRRDAAEKSATGNTAPMVPAEVGPLPEVPETEQRHLTFLNSRIFDRNLSTAMTGQVQHVVIDVAGSFSLDVIPERIEKWLFAVQDSDGLVQAQALPSSTQVATRSAELIALLQVAASYYRDSQAEAREKILYAPAQAYHARIFYQQETGNVTQVTFHRR